MKYFLDTEFVEGKQRRTFCNITIGTTLTTISLISIGIVAEDNRTYYAVSKDFNLKEAWRRYDKKEDGSKKYWLRDNVLFPIWQDLVKQYCMDNMTPDEHTGFTYSSMKTLLALYGKSNKQIAEEIIQFVRHEYFLKHKINRTPIEFYGYYSDYDWVVFCWLFGLMKDLPEGFPMYCIDLQQTLDEKLKLTQFLKSKDNYPKQVAEHHALNDAKWTRDLYYFLK